ncbi:OmpA family protein [Pseudomonas caspiana]|nr:OmpA family protein [Pseudomonas caspiana]TPG90209.1 OmpA family protein [Pseudomonas caspiana]
MTTKTRALMVASLALAASTAGAVDVRQMVIPDSVGVAVEPAHQAHVLGEAIRDSQVKRTPTIWVVTEPSRTRALMPEEEARLDAIDAEAAEEARHVRTTLLFGFDKSSPSEWAALENMVGEALRTGSVVKLVGHADDVGSDAYNQRLSENRAISVARYLIKRGVSKKNIKVAGRGKRDPVSIVDSSMNRRVEVDVIKAAGNTL